MPLGMFTFLDFLLVWLALKAALEMAASFEHDTKIAPFFKYLYTLVSYVLERTRSWTSKHLFQPSNPKEKAFLFW